MNALLLSVILLHTCIVSLLYTLLFIVCLFGYLTNYLYVLYFFVQVLMLYSYTWS